MNKNNVEILRIPYKGSKQSIVHKIYNIINADLGNHNCLFSQESKITTIYDLFCGGGSVGYYFYQNKYNVYMNDISRPLIDLHRVLNMQDSPLTKELLYKWISREEFYELIHRQDWYGELIKCCWSFGNGSTGYLFGKDIEEYKRQLHFVVVNKCTKAGKKWLKMIGKENDWDNFSKIYNLKSQKKRRLFIRNYVIQNTRNKAFGKHNDPYLYCTQEEYKHIKDFSIVEKAKYLNNNKINVSQLQSLEQLQQLERIEQLESLEQLQQLERIEQLESLQQLERLERIEQLQQLQQLQRLKQLESLEQLQQLERLERIEQLQQIQRLEQLKQLQQLESLEQLQRLKQLQSVKSLEKFVINKHNIYFSCKNYWEFEFERNSIIYCDPPYINTSSYNKQTFDFDKFDKWVDDMKNKGIKVYISEYTNHNEAWREIGSIDKYSLFTNNKKVKTKKQEKVFCNI